MTEPRASKPPRTCYQRGAALEVRVMRELESLGYRVCRSAGSGGSADLWAARRDRGLLLIQVRRAGNLGPKEWDSLYIAAYVTGGIPILASAQMRRPIRYQLLTGTRLPYQRARPIEDYEP